MKNVHSIGCKGEGEGCIVVHIYTIYILCYSIVCVTIETQCAEMSVSSNIQNCIINTSFDRTIIIIIILKW